MDEFEARLEAVEVAASPSLLASVERLESSVLSLVERLEFLMVVNPELFDMAHRGQSHRLTSSGCSR